jgi:prolyl 4-hydroxylase
MDLIVHSDDAFSLGGFLSPAECDEHIRRSERLGYEVSRIDTGRGMALDRDIRNNERVLLDDSALAGSLWARSRHYFPNRPGQWKPSGLNERFRYYKYERGSSFRWHRDGSFEKSRNERSQLTFMIYLNDDFTGGETDFGDFSVVPSRGDALCFLHSLTHEGQEVSRGIKYVLRTDVMYRRQSRWPS